MRTADLNKPKPLLSTHTRRPALPVATPSKPVPGLTGRAPDPDSPQPAPDTWRWPLGPPAPKVLRVFSPPPTPWTAGHRGVDLAARPGQIVRAAASGEVSYAGRLAGRGVIAITHGTLRTTYLPVRAGVRVGRQVRIGARIGELEDGPFHCPTACLHWGLLQGRIYLDPLSLVRRHVRLLPFWTPPSPAATPPPVPARQPHPEPRMGLRDATTATGGACVGLALAYGLAFTLRRTRTRSAMRRPHRPPPGVVDLARERRLRRTP
ncbi:M23 family metallopeptidase [Actinomadura graeca]|uniref:M23 family metallopeptidase n=2 Tax=Actinomadura graeca TaxID=2750812 RepID=A0ABX8R7R0_9ACTN|nr:M23 family metallopeptidase [Actinomadura graeca]